MRAASLRTLFFSLFMALFAALVLHGAPRLFMSGDPSCAQRVRPTEQVYLSAAAPAPQRERAFKAAHPECQNAARVPSTQEMREVPHAPNRDANGNVLRGAPYLRTVYQAFSLGDGFA